MGSKRGLGITLATRCCYGAFFGFGFLIASATIIAMFWLIWCYFGLVSVQISETQRRGAVNYSQTTSKPSTISPVSISNRQAEYATNGGIETSSNNISKLPTTVTTLSRGTSRGESQIKFGKTKNITATRNDPNFAKGDFGARDKSSPNVANRTLVGAAVKDNSTVAKLSPEQSTIVNASSRHNIPLEHISKAAILTPDSSRDDEGIQTRRVSTSIGNRPLESELPDSRNSRRHSAGDTVNSRPEIDPSKVRDTNSGRSRQPEPDYDKRSRDEIKHSSKDDVNPTRFEGSDNTRRESSDYDRDSSRRSRDEPRDDKTTDRDRPRYDRDESRGTRSQYDSRDRYPEEDDYAYPKGDRKVTYDDDVRIKDDDRRRYDDRYKDDNRYRDRKESTRDSDSRSRDTDYRSRDDDRYRDRDDRPKVRDDDDYRRREEPRQRDRDTTDDYRSRARETDKGPRGDDERYRDRESDDRYKTPRTDDDRYKSRDDESYRYRSSGDDRSRDRYPDDRSRDRYPDDRSRDEDRYRKRDDDRYRSREDDRYRSRDDDRYISRDDDRYKTRDETRYRDRTDVDDRYSTSDRARDDRYVDSRRRETMASDTLGDRKPPLIISSTASGERRSTDYDEERRERVRPRGDLVSSLSRDESTRISESRKRDDDEDRISPTRTREDTYIDRSTLVETRRREEPRYYDDRDERRRDDKYYDDDRRYPSVRIDGSRDSSDSRSTKRVTDVKEEYQTRVPERSDSKYVDDEDEIVLGRRSYASEEDDKYRERTKPYDYEDRERRPSESRYRDVDKHESRDSRPRADYDDGRSRYRDDKEYRRYDKDDDRYRSDDRRRESDAPSRKHDTNPSDERYRERDTRKDYSRDDSDDERPIRRRPEIPIEKDEHLYESPDRRYDDRGSTADRRATHVREPLADSPSREASRVVIREKRYQNSPSSYKTNDDTHYSTSAPHIRDSQSNRHKSDFPPEDNVESPLTAKDVIEVALRHPDVPNQNERKVFYPVFDPRISNLTSSDLIRRSDRRGTTITSKKK